MGFCENSVGQRALLLSALSLLGCGGEVASLSTEAETAEAIGETAEALSSLPDTYLDGYCDWRLQVGGTTTLWVSPTGSDSNSGATEAQPLASLNGALAKIEASGSFTKDYRIIVKGGTYWGHRVDWGKADPDHRIQIEAAAGETPIFDGRLSGETQTVQPHFFDMNAAWAGTRTNLTMRGLTVRYYGQNGVAFKGECNRVYDNIVTNIGSAYSRCKEVPYSSDSSPGDQKYFVLDRPECVTYSQSSPGGCKCEGFGSVNLGDTSKSLIKHNDIIDSLNIVLVGADGTTHGTKPNLLHAMYLAYGASQNRIEDNYIRHTSGTAIKNRDGSNDNEFLNNYMDRAGARWVDGQPVFGGYFFTSDDSSGLLLKDNVLTFSTYGRTNKLVDTASHFIGLEAQDTPSLVQKGALTDEKVSAMTTADVDGDGAPELFAALNYRADGAHKFSKLVYRDGWSGELRTAAYSSDYYEITALAAGDFNGSGKDQVAVALFAPSANQSYIMVGSLEDGVYRYNTRTTLYNKAGASSWRVSAMAAGKFSGDTSAKLITAAVVDGVQKVFRGDGKTAQAGSSMAGVDNGTPLYSSSSWRVTALTAGVLSGSTTKLISGFQWIGSGTPKNRIYLGDGVTGAATTQVWDTTNWLIKALVVGRFGPGGNPRLVTGFDVDGVGKVYSSNDFATVIDATQLYTSQHWDITSLTKSRFSSASTTEQLITAFDLVEKTEIWAGNGTSTGGGATNVSSIYRNPDPTLPSPW